MLVCLHCVLDAQVYTHTKCIPGNELIEFFIYFQMISGAKVLVTDQEPLMAQLNINIELNHAKNVVAKILNW